MVYVCVQISPPIDEEQNTQPYTITFSRSDSIPHSDKMSVVYASLPTDTNITYQQVEDAYASTTINDISELPGIIWHYFNGLNVFEPNGMISLNLITASDTVSKISKYNEYDIKNDIKELLTLVDDAIITHKCCTYALNNHVAIARAYGFKEPRLENMYIEISDESELDTG